MRTVRTIGILVLLAGAALGQNRSGYVNTPGVRGFGSVVFPGGTSAMPGIQRTTGSVVFPAGGNRQIAIPSIPFSVTDPNFATRLGAITQGRPPVQNRPGQFPGRQHGGNTVVYAYPVYVGSGYYDNPYLQAPQQPPANVTVIYPPQQATPVIVQYPADASYTQPQQPVSIYEPPVREQVMEPARMSEPSHYMIAFKDHSIYAAVAYWVEGETLHYFTTGNVHNQASVSLIDRDLTGKLNHDSGLEVKLPPAN